MCVINAGVFDFDLLENKMMETKYNWTTSLKIIRWYFFISRIAFVITVLVFEKVLSLEKDLQD